MDEVAAVIMKAWELNLSLELEGDEISCQPEGSGPADLLAPNDKHKDELRKRLILRSSIEVSCHYAQAMGVEEDD